MPGPDPEGLTERDREIVGEFKKIAERIAFSNNKYYGRGELNRLLARNESELRGLGLVDHLLRLSWHYLRIGDVEESLIQVEKAMQMKDLSRFPTGYALMSRALTHLRRAEVNNCIKRHNCDCCIFPLTGGGVHVDRDPALAAKRDLLACLEIDPSNLQTVWILNLLTMALGEYPHGVPDAYRIPASAFESDINVPRFRDVAGRIGCGYIEFVWWLNR